MKKLSILLLLAVVSHAVFAQSTIAANSINPYPKTITVSGSAEMYVVPDIIKVTVTLKEYQKKGQPKKMLEPLKEQFLASCKKVGIADSLINISSYSGSDRRYYYYRKQRDEELFASIAYQITFNNSAQIDKLVALLDQDATENFEISTVSHTRASEFRKELKIKAIQAAKEKATYLAAAIDEKIGDAITITEPGEWGGFYGGYNQNSISQSNISNNAGSSDGGEGLDFKKIKFRYEMNVVFGLK